MKKLKILCASFVLVILSSSQLMASAVIEGTINRVLCSTKHSLCEVTISGGVFRFGESRFNSSGGTDDCHAQAGGYRYRLDVSTSEGKNILSMVMAAKISSSSVSISGTGTCDNVVGTLMLVVNEVLQALELN